MTDIKRSFVVELFSLLWTAKDILFFNILMIAEGAIVFIMKGLNNSDGTWIDSVYAALITSLTIGYGAMTPIGLYGKTASVLPGIVGMLFVGVIVRQQLKHWNVVDNISRQLDFLSYLLLGSKSFANSWPIL